MLLLGETEAEAKIVVPEVRTEVVAIRRAAVPRTVVPAPATVHAARPTHRTCRIILCIATVFAIPVLTPFPNISTHVVDAKLVGLLGRYVMRGIAAIVRVPTNLMQVVTSAVLIMLGVVATSRCEFPFSLCRQTEGLAGTAVQLTDEFLTVVPRDTFYRFIVAIEA